MVNFKTRIFFILLALLFIQSFALAEKTSVLLVDKDFSLVRCKKEITLAKGENLVTFGPVGKGVVVESVYPEIEGCQVLEQKIVPPSVLVWKVNSAIEDTTYLDVSYLTKGISWSVNYKINLDSEEKSFSFTCFLTVENRDGGDFALCELGFLSPIEFFQNMEKDSTQQTQAGFPPECNVKVEEDNERIIYFLTKEVNLPQDEVKTFFLFSFPKISTEKVYFFDGEKYGDEVREELHFKNPSGVFFPEGKLYLYKTTSGGRKVYLGERELGQIPPGREASIYLGPAKGIIGYRVQTFYKEVELTPVEKDIYNKDIAREYEYRLIFSNMRPDPVKIKVVEHFYGWWKIIESEPESYEKREKEIIYYLELPPNSKRIIRYKARTI